MATTAWTAAATLAVTTTPTRTPTVATTGGKINEVIQVFLSIDYPIAIAVPPRPSRRSTFYFMCVCVTLFAGALHEVLHFFLHLVFFFYIVNLLLVVVAVTQPG